MVVCLEQGADLLMPLPVTVSCFSKIQIGFTFLVPAHLGSPRQRAVKRVCVCVFTAQWLNGMLGLEKVTMVNKKSYSVKCEDAGD